MAVQERDSMKGDPAPSSQAPVEVSWLKRLNDLGERHARKIVTASTFLVIVVVLIFAKYFYEKSILERANKDLSTAEGAVRLRELKEKYGQTSVAPTILYRLGNQLYEEGLLVDAKKEYQEFEQRFPTHPLASYVKKALASLERNQRFEEDEKPFRLRAHRLQSHPQFIAQAADPRLLWTPAPGPQGEISIGTTKVKFELFEDEAPNAVANFIKLCDKKYFDGIKVDLVNTDERLKTLPKEKEAIGYIDYTLAAEPSSREIVEGLIVLVRKEGAAENLGGEFQVLLKAPAELKDVTVIGVVTEGLPAIKGLKKDDTLTSVAVTSRRRASAYEPQVIKKP